MNKFAKINYLSETIVQLNEARTHIEVACTIANKAFPKQLIPFTFIITAIDKAVIQVNELIDQFTRNYQ